eukprot:Blabericola_migrator_1__7182@NODE_3642_length_1610_cov_84_409592_g2257_i0_p2_GENE_NODE_3642_length_1610_cov_84_409592_g2257_i0NODE_3642_length_1610_cov_84_409592_g2257_i0_p2_ORF_typecomplete_len179_score32_47RRM_1/PF00076_22/2_5e15CENPF_leu_zip/PF10473_9/0_0072Swi5/PF07061_11/0_06DUF2785/PF10978_8/2_8DUF2785/PF10978_8/45RRM_7/PF16367_5/0_18_NODE_3642_length_1610_cov_84_409592_g2257_i0230766
MAVSKTLILFSNRQSTFLQPDKMNDIWVGNLPYNTTELDIRRLCSFFGEIDNLEFHKDPHTGLSMGWVFCRYKDYESGLMAREVLDGMMFGNRSISVQWAASKSNNGPVVVKDGKQQNHLALQQEIARMTLTDLSALLMEIDNALTHHSAELTDIIADNVKLLQSYQQARDVHDSLMS